MAAAVDQENAGAGKKRRLFGAHLANADASAGTPAAALGSGAGANVSIVAALRDTVNMDEYRAMRAQCSELQAKLSALKVRMVN